MDRSGGAQGFGMHMGMHLELRQTQQQTFRLDSPDHLAQELYREYADRAPSRLLVPTLDGPRLRYFHVVSLPRLQEAWTREKWAAIYSEKTFVSDLVPPDWVRYALVHLYHLGSGWCNQPQGPARKLTAGPPHYRATEIELSVARAELSVDTFDQYWEFRRSILRTNFFRRGQRLMDESRVRIDRLADLWQQAGGAPGKVWATPDLTAEHWTSTPRIW